jgi:hypothetical protein
MFDTGETPSHRPSHFLFKFAILIVIGLLFKECILMPREIRPDKGRDTQEWRNEILEKTKTNPIPEKEAAEKLKGAEQTPNEP